MITTSIKVDQVLDCKGDICPMPVLKTKRAMEKLAPGQVLMMQCTEPGSGDNLASWCEHTGNELIKSESNDGVFTHYIRKK